MHPPMSQTPLTSQVSNLRKWAFVLINNLHGVLEQFLKSQIILFPLHQYFSYQLPVQTSRVCLLHLFCLDFWWEHGGKVNSILKTQPSSGALPFHAWPLC